MALLVVVASFVNQQSYWKVTNFDLLCGAISLSALYLWAVEDSPRAALVLAVIGDGFAALPTLIKAWRYPHTETGACHVATFISAVLVMPAIPEWNLENAAFQVYMALLYLSISLAIFRRKFVFWGESPPRAH